MDKNGPEWLRECQARAVANMARPRRIEFMKRYAKRHGKTEGNRLRKQAKEQWLKIEEKQC